MKKVLFLGSISLLLSIGTTFAADPSVDQLLDIILHSTGANVTPPIIQPTSSQTGSLKTDTVIAAPLPSPSQDDEFTAALSWMYTKGLTQFSSQKLYEPINTLTRQQAAKFFVVMQENIIASIPVTSKATCTFTDTGFDASLRAFVDKACAYGIMQGKSGIFRPQDHISRPEFIAALIRMIEGAKRDESKNPRWISYYMQARDRGITKEQNAGAFDGYLTRYEAALYLYRSLGVIKNTTLSTNTGANSTTGTTSSGTATATNAHTTSLIADPELQEAIYWMRDNGMTKYTSTEQFRPFDAITRQEAAKIFSIFKNTTFPSAPSATGTVCAFSDLAKADASLSSFIVDACKMNIFKGGTGLFEPESLLTKPQAVAILIRLLEGSKDETTSPRWSAYYKRAVELDMIQDSSPELFDKPISRYEIAMLLYNTKVKQNIIKNLNNDVEVNKLIYPVPGTTTTGAKGKIEGLVSLNTQILDRGTTDMYTVDLFGDQYKIEKSATQKYLTNDYVRYGKMLTLDQANELGTVVFTISNNSIIDGVIRPYKVAPEITFYITPSTQQPYYTMTKIVK